MAHYSAAPFSLAYHQRWHLLGFNLSAAWFDAASAARIPANVKQLDIQG